MSVDSDGSNTGGDNRFAGHLYFRGDRGYEEARTGRIWHRNKPDREPAAILMAAGESDLVEGVRMAKERGWKVAVRAGGHSFPVWSVRDEGLLIDLGGYKDISYDPDTHIVSATPSVAGGSELNPYLKQFGRYFAGGGCPSVGLGGFLLQGGMGWNFRNWGYACEQLVAVDVVTAGGELVRADEHQNSDLFWAARGTGPGFCGLIAKFHIRTRPITDGMAVSLQVYPVECYEKVLAWMWEQHPNISDKVYFNAVAAPPPIPVPNYDGRLVFIMWGAAFGDTYADSEAALAPLKDCPFRGEAVMVVDAQPTSLPEQLGLVDQLHPQDYFYRVDSAWVDGSREEIIKAMRNLILDQPEEDIGYTFLIFKMPRPEAPDMAMSLQTELCVGKYAIYANDADHDHMRDWLRSVMGDLEPFTVGQNWGDSDQTFREVKCLTDEAWQRYQGVRDKWDPDGLFHSHLAGEGGFRNRNSWEITG